MASPKRQRPEFDTVAVPIKREMENAGFVARFLGKTMWSQSRLWVSAVPRDTPDWYYHHPIRKLSIWVETKAPGEKPTPGQAAFLEDHAGSETQAVCWDRVEECIGWLAREGLYDLRFGKAYYPYGIHRVPDPNVTEEEWSS